MAFPLLLPFLASGCMTLDGLILPSHPIDAYDVPTDVIPAEAMEWVQFPSGDGTELWGVWLRHGITDDVVPKGVILHVHGNGGPLGNHEWERVEAHWSWGYDVFAYDYRGYGRSGGEPTAEGIFEQDGPAAARYVSEATGLPPEEIAWIGLSLGSVISLRANGEVPAKAVVLEQGFASTDLLIEGGLGLALPSGWAFRQDFDNVVAIADMTSPLFLIHGAADDYVSPDHGDALFAAAPDNPKWFWGPEGVQHSDITEVIPDEYRRRVEAFLDDPTKDPNRPPEE